MLKLKSIKDVEKEIISVNKRIENILNSQCETMNTMAEQQSYNLDEFTRKVDDLKKNVKRIDDIYKDYYRSLESRLAVVSRDLDYKGEEMERLEKYIREVELRLDYKK